MAKPHRVLIGILAGDQKIHASLARIIHDVPYMNADESHEFLFIPWICVGRSPQMFARNCVCQMAEDKGADTVVMIDNDMVYHGPESMYALLRTDAHITGSLQLMWRPEDSQQGGKTGPHIFPVAMKLDDSQPIGKQAYVVWGAPGVDVTPVDAVGSGYLSIRRAVLCREMEIEAGYTPKAYWRDVYLPNGKRVRGLDVDFCARAKKLGFRVAVNWTATVGHNKTVDLFAMEIYAKNQFELGYEQGVKHGTLQVAEAQSGKGAGGRGKPGPDARDNAEVAEVGVDRAHQVEAEGEAASGAEAAVR